MRRLLGVENAIFNLKPVSENIGLCDAETWSQVVACWQSEDKQLEMILQRWQMNLVSEEGPGILKTYLMGLQPEGNLAHDVENNFCIMIFECMYSLPFVIRWKTCTICEWSRSGKLNQFRSRTRNILLRSKP